MQQLTVFIFGLVCLSAVSAKPMTDEMMEHMKASKEKCMAESGIDEATLEHFKPGQNVDEEKMSCFGACMMQQMGFMTESGELQPEEAIKKLPDGMQKDKAEELINLCSKEKGGNPCETAAQVFKCLHENKAMDMLHMPMN